MISLRENDYLPKAKRKEETCSKNPSRFLPYLINIKINHNGAMVRGEEGIIVEDDSELLRRECALVIEERVVDRFAIGIGWHHGSEIEAK